MRDKIYTLYKNIKLLNNKLNPSVLASSISFYIIITIIPIFVLLFSILYKLNLTNEKLINIPNNCIGLIIMVCSLIWSISKLINNLMIITHMVYDNKNISKIKLRINAIMTTIVLLITIIIMICIILYLNYIKDNLNINYIIIFDFIQYSLIFCFVLFIFAGIYKYIIPRKVSFKETLFSSFVITIILFVMTIIYKVILKNILVIKYIDIYGSFASIIVTFVWLYYNCYLFIFGIGIIIYKQMYNI